MKKTRLEFSIAKTSKTVQPPLKRAELVEALAHRHIEKITQERHELEGAYNAAQIELKSKAAELMQDSAHVTIGDLDVGFSYSSKTGKHELFWARKHVTLNDEGIDRLKPFIGKVLSLKVRLNTLRVPSYAEAKATVRAGLDGSPVNRVAAVLQDPAARAALDNILTAIGNNKAPLAIQG